MIKKILLTLLTIPSFAAAQDSMTADAMRANGKIYVVVAVAAIVIAVSGIYMISIDRKVSRLEKRLKDKN
jgi:hypothetical protein